MLYDPKWQRTFALDTLVGWLERQPAKKRYVYESTDECLLAQYFTDQGFYHEGVGSALVISQDKYFELPQSFNRISFGNPRTFGAALARARKELAAYND